MAQLILHNTNVNVKTDAVVCVLALIFTPDGHIVTVTNKRGVDIPGGHVEPDDADFEATARRELKEEAQITAGELSLCGFIERVDGNDISYMPIITGFLETIDPFTANDEIMSRDCMTVEEFLSVYKAADTELMRAMIIQAVACL